jgi:hypothetical protein
MKLIKFIYCILLLLFSYSLQGQVNIDSMKKDMIILKDTLWRNQCLWQKFNLFGKVKFNKENADFVEFYSVPVCKFNSTVLKYDFGMDFSSTLSKDSTRIAGFILFKDEAIGFLNGFNKNGKWNASPIEVFNDQSPFKIAFNLVKSNDIQNIFAINPIGNLCYTVNCNTLIFDPLYKDFIKIERFIKERITIEGLRNYFFSSESVKNSPN